MRKGRRVHRQLVTQFGFVWPTVMITLLIKIVELKKKQVSSSSRPCKGKTYYNNNRRSNIPLSFFQVSGRVHQPTTPLLPANKKEELLRVLIRANYSRKQLHLADPSLVATKTRGHTHTETKTIFPHHQIRDDHFLQHPKSSRKSDGLLLLKIKKEKWKFLLIISKCFPTQTTQDDYKIKFPDDFGRSDREVEELFESERPKISRPRPDVATSPV